MNHYPILIVGLIVLTLAACASSKKRKRNQAEAEQTATAPPNVAPVSPGSAQVAVKILSFEETPGGYHCRIKVQRVDAYGSGTPPLPEGSDIEILVRKDILFQSEPSKDASEILAADTPIEMILRYQKAPEFGGVKSPLWHVVRFNK